MTDRPKLKLDNAGDEAVMLVKYVNAQKTKFGPKVVFVGTVRGIESETPLIAEETADKRLERINLTRETAVGETLRFWRKENPSGRPFWEIDVASPAEANPTPSKRLPPPARPAPQGRSAGPHIPEMDGPPAHHRDVPLPEPEDAPYRADEPKRTPHEERETETPQSVKRVAFIDFYAETYEAMLHRMSNAHYSLSAFVQRKDDTPLTAEAVQAATATVIIQLDRKGLLP